MANENVKMCTLTIDGREVQAPAGTNVVQAAAKLGIYIPHYCYHPALTVAGNCRLCLVELEGAPKPVIACNLPVADGMKVITDSKTVKDCREGMMEFLLINHPLDCPICDRGGECMLQRYSMDYGTGSARLTDDKVFFKKEDFDPVIDLERNRCILCTRCVRVCDEICGESSLGVFQRGDHSFIASYENKPIDSIFSGNVIETCPVGALTSKPYRFKARPWEMHQTQGTCSLCSAGCQVTFWSRDGHVLRTTPRSRQRRNEYIINEDNCEFICNVGRFAHDFMNQRDARIQAPMVRAKGELARATWDATAHGIANAVQRIIEQHGAGAAGVWASPYLANEELFTIQNFAREVVKTENIDWRGLWSGREGADLASAAMAAAEGNLDKPSDYGLILCLSGSLQHEIPVTALRIKEAARRKSTKLAIVSERVDAWMGQHAAFTAKMKPAGAAATVKALAQGGAGGDAAMKPLADLVAASAKTLVVWNLEDNAGRDAATLTPAALELKAALGDKIHLMPLVSPRNAAGAFALGCEPERKPGAAAAGGKGLSLTEMIDAAANGKLKALFVFGSEVIERLPVASEKMLAALRNLELLIVSDIFPTALHDMAHVVLPARTIFEKEGSMMNIEGGIHWFERGEKRLPVDARDAREVTRLLAEAMGHRAEAKDERATLRDLMDALMPSLEFSPGELIGKGPGNEAPIRYSLYEHDDIIPQLSRDKFETVPDITAPVKRRKNELSADQLRQIVKGAKAPAAEDGDLVLAGGWDIRGDGLWMGYSETLQKLHPVTEAIIAAADAQKMGISDGDMIELSAAGFTAAVKAVVSDEVAAGVVYAALNLLGGDVEPLVTGAARPKVKVKKAEANAATAR